MYDKKIAYLHYIKHGELMGNAGHVKVTQRANNVSVEVYVREAYGILNGCYYIQNLGGNPFENKINIEEGQAVYKKRLEVNKNDRDAIPYGLKIEIGRDEYLEAIWRAKNRDEEKAVYGEKAEWEVQKESAPSEEEKYLGINRSSGNYAEEMREDQMEGQDGRGDRKTPSTIDIEPAKADIGYKLEKISEKNNEIWTDTWGIGERLTEKEPGEQKKIIWTNNEESVQKESAEVDSIQGESIQGEAGRTETAGSNTVRRNMRQRESIQEDTERYTVQSADASKGTVRRETAVGKQRYQDTQMTEKDLSGQEGGTWKSLTFSVPVETYEDKWEELCKKYEVIHPFGNREEYLSLSPKDFIIFPEKYQHLVNNSFLLHGYYNYRHVILGKKEEGGKNIYYLGVPGVYYEREKMVAIMFGFEGFECGEKRAIAGGFGYYMRRVEL